MNNDEIRTLAKEEYGASCAVFNQGNVDGGLCTAYVCWWIRRRLKGKTEGWSGKFHRVPGGTLEGYPDDWYYAQANAGKQAFEKARALQKRLNGQLLAQEGYVMKEGSGKTAHRIKHVDINVGQDVDSHDAENLLDAFRYAEAHKCIVDIGIQTKQGHAVALDFRTASPVYFDPNLGECRFTHSKGFLGWWHACYERQGDQGQGAFDNFKQRFFATFYQGG